MLRFPIQWEIPLPVDTVKESDKVISELALNKEFEIKCLLENNGKVYHAFVISRKITSKQMLATGQVFIQQNGRMLSSQDFFKLMEPGSSTERLFVIDLLEYAFEPVHTYREIGYSKSPYKLSGAVYITSISEISDQCKHCQPLLELSKDLVRLLEPQTSFFTDVNLKCGDVLIPTHKNILSARSAVFAAMFTNEMKENYINQVDITDMDSVVVRELLTYVYTGVTSNLTVPLASGLLFAADKYQLENLKSVCCDFLKNNISIENAMSILVLGDLHAEDLKSFAEDFICNKCPDFSVFEDTEEWKIMREEKPNLTVDILTSLMKLKNKKPEVNGETIKSRDSRRKFPFPKNLFKSRMFNRFY